jgi:hypothetical protein
MKKIADIADLIERAHDIRNTRAGAYRAFQDSYSSGQARIHKSGLSRVNRNAEDIYERQQLRQLFRDIQSTTKSYKEALSAAKKQAEDVIHAAAPAPDREIVDRFERRLADLRTEILITPTPERASERLRDFIAGIDDPYFATRIRQEYAQLATPIIEAAGNNAARFKLELSGAFEQLKETALTPEARQAVELHENAEALLQSRIYPMIVQDRISGTFGWKVSALISDPDAFFSSDQFEQDENRIKDEEQQLAMALAMAETNQFR